MLQNPLFFIFKILYQDLFLVFSLFIYVCFSVCLLLVYSLCCCVISLEVFQRGKLFLFAVCGPAVRLFAVCLVCLCCSACVLFLCSVVIVYVVCNIITMQICFIQLVRLFYACFCCLCCSTFFCFVVCYFFMCSACIGAEFQRSKLFLFVILFVLDPLFYTWIITAHKLLLKLFFFTPGVYIFFYFLRVYYRRF